MPVFSNEYPKSADTLDQLEKMMYVRKAAGRPVFPIYLDGLDRSVVGKQKGAYDKAFAEHENCHDVRMGKINAWRGALAEAAGLGGLCLKHYRTEKEFIDKVVEVVKEELNPTVPDVNAHSSWYITSFFRWSGSSKVGDGQASALVGKV